MLLDKIWTFDLNFHFKWTLTQIPFLLFEVDLMVNLGAIPFCRTNMPQGVASFDCSNPIFGTTCHPKDPSRSVYSKVFIENSNFCLLAVLKTCLRPKSLKMCLRNIHINGPQPKILKIDNLMARIALFWCLKLF